MYVLALKQVGADGMAFGWIVDGISGVQLMSIDAILTHGLHYLYGCLRELPLIVPRIRWLYGA